MTWYKVALSFAEIASGKHGQLIDAFAQVFVLSGGPKEAGMFWANDVMSNDYFFSPAAVQIAKPIIVSYGGVKCSAPKRSEVASLVTSYGGEAVPFASESCAITLHTPYLPGR